MPLDELTSKNITVDGSTHKVIIAEGGNIIRDSINHLTGNWFATRHAWKYFYQYVAAPIKDHITSNNLDSIIYIVLCKGTPFYIQAACDSTNVIANLAVDGLLAMLGTNNYDILLDSIYNKYRSYAINGNDYFYGWQRQIINPYYYADPNLSMNHRFKPGIFTRNWNGHTIKMDYLVSHLDGISYNIVKGMIDHSKEAIHANNYDWFIDADPDPCHGGSIMVDFANSTASNLNSIGFNNYSFNTDNDTVTWHNKPVMSYSSNGVHTTKPPLTGEGETLHPDYIQNQLNFNYAFGAIFNTAESYNAWRLSSVTRASAPMGQVVEFFLEGGTLGLGHANEPYTGGVVNDGILLPSYQVGYPFIDAAYMGMHYLAWQNIVIGDPLTTIAWGKQILTQNTTWNGPNLVTGTITIPAGKTLTIANDAVINFKHLGSLQVDGALVIQPGAELNFNNGKSIAVNGTLSAQGTSNNRIHFDFFNSQLPGIKINAYASLNISYSDIQDAQYGILTESDFNNMNIEQVNISNCTSGGIGIFGPYAFDSEITPTVKNCTITSCDFGIYAANDQEIVLYQNTINNCNIGIGTSLVPVAYIIGNNISSTAAPTLPGIMLYSSNGNVRANTVRNHTDGIYLGNSSPDIGENTLEGNLYHGIYIGGGSIPNLVAHIAGDPPVFWAISGYNTIKENGTETGGREDNDGSEIYISDADILLNRGCNIIADDRTHTPDLPTIFLMNGKQRDYHDIYAEANYWGTVAPSNERFGDLPVIFEPYNNEPCPFPQSQCQELMVETSKGELIDELIPRKCDVGPLSAIEESYAEANMLYATGEVNTARQIYEQITASENTNIKKLYAYNKLYTIGNLIDTTDNYFSALQNIFSNLAQTIEDSTLMKIFAHNSTLCKVSKEEYVAAINDFEYVITQNPNSEEAFHAEMDLMTTALLVDTSSNQLGKTVSGKYFVKGSNDYMTKLNRLIKKNFGVEEENTTKGFLPEEFTLMQNYPNPFNPITMIEYKIPMDTWVELKVYDILGREVKTMVDKFQAAGKYFVEFDASDLSSGVYFYKLVAQGFVKSMKAVVIK